MKILGLNISKAKNLLPVLINPDLPKKDANKLITAYNLPRVRQDIGNWREAMQEMERPYVPYRVKAQILYQDVAINGHVFACMRKRKDMVMLKKWAIVDENNNINEILTLDGKKDFKIIPGIIVVDPKDIVLSNNVISKGSH